MGVEYYQADNRLLHLHQSPGFSSAFRGIEEGIGGLPALHAGPYRGDNVR